MQMERVVTGIRVDKLELVVLVVFQDNGVGHLAIDLGVVRVGSHAHRGVKGWCRRHGVSDVVEGGSRLSVVVRVKGDDEFDALVGLGHLNFLDRDKLGVVKHRVDLFGPNLRFDSGVGIIVRDGYGVIKYEIFGENIVPEGQGRGAGGGVSYFKSKRQFG